MTRLLHMLFGDAMKPLAFLFLFIFTPTSTKGQIARSDTTFVFALIDSARAKQQRGLVDAAEQDFRQAGELAKALEFDRGILMYAGHYCVFLYEQVRYDDALTMARIQLEASKRLNDKQRMSYAYNNLSLQYQGQGKLRQAAESLIEALEISSAIEHPSDRDLSDRRKYYNNLSSLLLDMNDLEKGRHYALKALEVAEYLKDTLAIGRSLVNVVVAEAMAKRLDEAEAHGLRLLTIAQSQGDAQMQVRAYNNLGDIFRMQGRFALALATFKKAQQLLDVVPPGNAVYVFMGISSTYKDWGRYAAAETYYRRALELAKSELAKPQLSELYRSGAEIMESLGAYQEALSLRKYYEQLNDSLRNHEIHTTIQELEVQYQTAEKEKALAERDLKISEQRGELERMNTWIVLSVSLVVLLVLVLVFGRLIRKQQRKTAHSEQANRLLQAQLQGEERERTRTARELHDGVASILSAATLHLNSQNGSLRPLVGQLIENAVQEIRNISHNLAPEIVLNEGLALAVQEFCRRVTNPGLLLECYVVGTLPKFDKTTELALYRVVQEAVVNIVKHAKATTGIVQLVGDGTRLSITIEDNGQGFDIKQIAATGIGLQNLESRLRLLGANHTLHSDPGHGTSLYIELDGQKKEKNIRSDTDRKPE